MSGKKSNLRVEFLTMNEKVDLLDLTELVEATKRSLEGTMSLVNTALIGGRMSRVAELLREAADSCDLLAYYEKIRVSREVTAARRAEEN